MCRNLDERSYLLDYHIPGLLVFPPKAQLYDHPLVEDGSLILQVLVPATDKRFITGTGISYGIFLKK